jgi:hypothetical protein
LITAKRRAVLREMAYAEAAFWLEKDSDAKDLDDSLTSDEEEFVRDFIRNNIVPSLRKKHK